MKQITELMQPKPKMRRSLLIVAVMLVLALTASACSSDNSTSETATAANSHETAATPTPSATDPHDATAAVTPPPSATEVPVPRKRTPSGTAPSTEPVTPGPASRSGEVEAYFQQLEASGYDGVVAVRDGSDITTRAFGVADRENNVPVDDETVFDIGSLTKQFTAAAILRLQMDGRLSVNDTLGDHVPGLPGDKAAITLHQLLTHTSGLPVGLGLDYEPIGRSDYIDLVGETPLTSEPGDQYVYSNVGYSLLTAVIERETGETYEAYVQTALFEPAGMLDTGYVLSDWEDRTVAVGYENSSGDRFGRPNELAWDIDGPYWHLRGNGGIMSTAADMLRWDEALNGDLVLDATAKSQLFATHVAEGPGEDSYYGYGWLIIPTPTGTPLIYHDGGNNVFYAGLLRLVDHDLAVFMATNSSHDAHGDVVFEVANAVLDGGLDAMFESDTDTTSDDSADPAGCTDTRSNADLVCGQLTVPVDYDEPYGDTMTLPYVVLPALGDDPSAEPLVFLQGGPGASTLAMVPFFVEESSLNEDRDMIFLEQRGTDLSGIFLSCEPEIANLDDIQECHDQYVADGIDLSAFTTLNAAKDLATLRVQLGIERWHLLGGSYGTTLAMVAMDNDPDGTASVILDAPTAPEVIIYNADIESLLNAFSKVFAECGADAGCSSRNPNLFDTNIVNAERLFSEPWNIAGTGLAEVLGSTIDHNGYLEFSRALVAFLPGALPAYITAIEGRDANAVLDLANALAEAVGDDRPNDEQPETAGDAFAQGLNWSIYCAEEAPFFDLETNPIETFEEWPPGTEQLFLDPVDLICEIWDVEPADPADVDQIVSAIPTLILAGEYDHTTPLRQGEIAAAGLSNSELIEVPSTGHTTLSNACARSIMVDFLKSPGGDRSCLADIAPIVWQ